MMRWNRKSFSLMSLSVVIALIVWSQMGIYLAHLFFGVSVKVNFFKFCISLFNDHSLYYFAILFILNALITYTVITMIVKMVKQYDLSRRFKNKVALLRNQQMTDGLIEQFNGMKAPIMVIDHVQALAFTMGLRKPCIVLSSGLITMLERQELEAVIEHETFHQQNHDSLKIFILQWISQALWFIPLTRWTYSNYKIISELRADEFAVQRMGSELGLGSALLKLIKNGFTENANPVLTRFVDGAVNYRLKQLIDPQVNIPVRLEMTSTVISVHVLLLFMSMIVQTIT